MKVIIKFYPNDGSNAVAFDLPSNMTADTFVREINAAIRREIDRAEAAGTTPDFVAGYGSGDQAFSEFIASLS